MPITDTHIMDMALGYVLGLLLLRLGMWICDIPYLLHLRRLRKLPPPPPDPTLSPRQLTMLAGGATDYLTGSIPSKAER